jgi:N-acetylglucosamine repressor
MRRIHPTAFRVARRGTFREINRQIALNLVRTKQPISRAELARLMGIRRGAASLLVNDLLDSGLVFEGAKGESRRGRRPTYLYIETRRRCTLAVDISASRTRVLAVDMLGTPLSEVIEFPTERRPRALVAELTRRIQRLLAERPTLGDCVGMGVVLSGLVDLERGRLRYSPTLGWRDVDLLTPLRAAIKVPVVVENSCKACVLAQVWALRGNAPVEGSVAFVNISDGVGVGIAIDGKLLRGAHNIAGEFGHVTLDPGGPICSCGYRGCWEAYVSKRAVIARFSGADPSWPASAEPTAVTLEGIISRARAGDPHALDTLRETAVYLAKGFAAIVKTFDPTRIYVGGELTDAWDLLAPAVSEVLRREALLREVGETEILTVGLGEYPRLRGAAALVNAPAFAAPVVA